jgi:hypothetical protein
VQDRELNPVAGAVLALPVVTLFAVGAAVAYVLLAVDHVRNIFRRQ